MTKRQRSPWFYVGCGCVAAVVLLVAGAAAMVFLGVRQVQQWSEEIKDPETREARVKAMLRAEDLPEGYHPTISLSIPYLMSMAVIADRELEEAGPGEDRLGQRLFVYIKTRRYGTDMAAMGEFFDGGEVPPGVFEDTSFEFHPEELIAHGEFGVEGGQAHFVARRGEYRFEGHERREGVVTLIWFECSGDDQLHLGIWIGPDEAQETPVAEIDWTSTNASPESVREFVDHFAICSP